MIARDHPLAGHILSLIPVNSLERRLQDEVLARGEVLSFRKRRVVFEVGARDPYTFYLLSGELELEPEEAAPMRMTGDDVNSLRALAQLQPRRYTAKTLSPVEVFRIERAVLDRIISDDQVLDDAASAPVVVEDGGEEDASDWMSRLLSSELFTRLPHENIQRFFAELEPVEMAAGAVVVEQGTPGDYLYIVAEGRCKVVREAGAGGEDQELATLNEGDTFGEESLISNSARNASVRMLTDGVVMRLAKASFEELVTKPTLRSVPYSQACRLVQKGAVWLDVRFKDEHDAHAIEGSSNAPLNALRQVARNLDRDRSYVVYCDTGARSSTGAFLLARLGFDACYLAGGLERSPLGDAAAARAAAAPVAAPGVDFDFEIVTAADAVPASAADEQAPPAGAPVDVPPAQPTGAAAPAAAAMHAQVTELKAQRDKAVVYGRQAAEAVRELKRRYEELQAAAREERRRRETLDGELAALRTQAERQLAMERARLEGELQKAVHKIRHQEQARLAAVEQSERTREQLEGRVGEAERSRADAARRRDEAEAARGAAEVALEEAMRAAREQAEAEAGRLREAEHQAEILRARLADAERAAGEASSDAEARQAALEQALEQAGASARAAREAAEAERARLDARVAELEGEHDRAVEELGSLRGAHEADLAAAREEAAAEAQGRHDAEEALAETEARLETELAHLREQHDRTLAEERRRLATELESRERQLRDELQAAVGESSAHSEAQRRNALELSRLEDEVRDARERLARQSQEHDKALDEVRAALEVRVSEAEQDLVATRAGAAAFEARAAELEALASEFEARVEEVEGARARAEQALEVQALSAREQLAAETARAEQAHGELGALRPQLEEARRRCEVSEAALQASLKRASGDVDGQREALEASRLELEEQLARLEQDRRELDQGRHEQQATLERELERARQRAGALERQSAELEDRRAAAEIAIAAREHALAEAEGRLRTEQSGWQEQVERAIEDERSRLAGVVHAREQQLTAEFEAGAAERLEQRMGEVRAEYEARAVDMRAQVETQVGELHTRYAALVDATRHELETKMAEQEAVLEDERRRLETENARLRESVVQTRRSLVAMEQGAASAAIPPPPPPAMARYGRTATVIEIDQDFLVNTPDATPYGAADEPSEAKDRVIGPSQLADIRRKMAEKIQASKTR